MCLGSDCSRQYHNGILNIFLVINSFQTLNVQIMTKIIKHYQVDLTWEVIVTEFCNINVIAIDTKMSKTIKIALWIWCMKVNLPNLDFYVLK